MGHENEGCVRFASMNICSQTLTSSARCCLSMLPATPQTHIFYSYCYYHHFYVYTYILYSNALIFMNMLYNIIIISDEYMHKYFYEYYYPFMGLHFI